MQEFEEQVRRIIVKLEEAKKTDLELKVFGADQHKYSVNTYISEIEINEFENTYNISLPMCYKCFLTQIGSHGLSFSDSAAGPFYGIYPFTKNIEEIAPVEYLSKPTKIYPNMSDDYWADLVQLTERENLSDEEFLQGMGEIYSGILPIGSQGCTYLHGLVLNGDHKGKVVNLDIGNDKPKFTYENNFLDWYERWLDEVISGELLINNPNWFGYSIAGSDKSLIDTYFLTDKKEVKIDCLSSLLNKREIDNSILDSIEKEYLTADKDIKKICLYILTKFNYEKAKPYLLDHSQSDLLTVFQSIFWYQKDKSKEWSTIVKDNLDTIEDNDTIRFGTYLLEEANKNDAESLNEIVSENEPTIVAETEPTIVTETEPTIVAETEPIIVAETEPIIVAETEPIIVAETEPIIVAETEPIIVAETEPIIVAETEPTIVAETEPIIVAETEPTIVAETEPTVFSENEPIIFTGNEPTVFSENEPIIFTGNEPTVFSENEPIIFTGNEPTIFSKNEPIIDQNDVEIEIENEPVLQEVVTVQPITIPKKAKKWYEIWK